MSVFIRPAIPPDAAAVTALVEAAYAHYVPRIGGRPQPMDADHAARIAAELDDVFVAVDENANRVVGVVEVTVHPDFLEIDNVAVAVDARGRGVGRALLDFAERHAIAYNRNQVRLLTHALMTENQAIYEGRGYVRIDRRTDNGFDRIFYRKDLEWPDGQPTYPPAPPEIPRELIQRLAQHCLDFARWVERQDDVHAPPDRERSPETLAAVKAHRDAALVLLESYDLPVPPELEE